MYGQLWLVVHAAISLGQSSQKYDGYGKETYVPKKKVASGNIEQNGRGERNKETFEFPL